MKRIGDILNSAAFAELRARAKRSDGINAAIAGVLRGAGLGVRCHARSVSNDGELILAVASQSEAAMLRQTLPTLIAALHKSGETGITKIRLRIQP